MINSTQFPTTIETLKHAAPIDNVHVDSKATIHMKTQNIGSHDVPYIHLFMEFECTNGKLRCSHNSLNEMKYEVE